jgi:hypothetical protein
MGSLVFGKVVEGVLNDILISSLQLKFKFFRTKESNGSFGIDHAVSMNAILRERKYIFANEHGLHYTLFGHTEVHANTDTFAGAKWHPSCVYIIRAIGIEAGWIECVGILPEFIHMVQYP